MPTITKSKQENDKRIVHAIEHALTEGLLADIPLLRQTDITRALLPDYPSTVDLGFSEKNVTRYNRRIGAYLSRVQPSILYDAYRELTLNSPLQTQTLCPWTGNFTYTKVYGNLNVLSKEECDKLFSRRGLLSARLAESLKSLHFLLESLDELVDYGTN